MQTSMQKITPFLWFDNQAEEAVSFYTSIFKNSRIVSITRYGEEGAEASGRPKGTVMTVAFQLDGQEFVALNGGPYFQVHRGNIICRQLRIAGRGGLLLGKTIRRRRRKGATMRLAERQIRSLMADSSHGVGRAIE